MKKPQLWIMSLTVALAAAACTRAGTEQQAREAASEVKQAAARAGETLADGWLTAKVQGKYFADKDIKARYIDVGTRDGVVTVKGYVENDTLRQRALDIARKTEGVKQVTDELLIGYSPRDAFAAAPASSPVATSGADETANRPAERPVADDAMITSLIQAKYYLDPSVKTRNVDVSTHAGVVTLRGQVASDDERAQALLLARTTEGVQRVEDSLTIDASLGQPPSPLRGSGAPGPTPPQGSSEPPASPGLGDARPAVPNATTQPPQTPRSGAASAPAASAPARSGDTAVASALETKIAGDAQLKGADIQVSARDGIVMLQGTVPNQAAKQRAVTMARQTAGVVQVVDRLTVASRKVQ
jgi:hyperosmotically inducible protein